MKRTKDYSIWETDIAELISEKLDCSYGDACAIMEAQPFIMTQSWGLDLSPEEVANKIVNL